MKGLGLGIITSQSPAFADRSQTESAQAPRPPCPSGTEVMVFPTFAAASDALAKGRIGPGQIVDILGYSEPGDGGGFRGILEKAASATLPGGGSIRPVERMLDVRMFGETGTPEHSTVTLQRAIDWSSANQQAVILPTRLDIVEPIVFGSNAGLQGLGAGFNSGVSPINCPAFRLDGDLSPDGWLFNVTVRDLCIWGQRVRSVQDYAVQLNQCYRIRFTNVMARGYRVSDSETRSIYSFTGKQNLVVFDGVYAVGTRPNQTGCGFRIANDPDGGLIHFSHLDAENLETGVRFEPGASAELMSSYFERVPICIEIPPGVRSVLVQGGIFRLSAGRAVGILFDEGEYGSGEHIAIIGPSFQPSDQTRTHFGFKTQKMLWRNHSPITLEGVDWRQIKMSDDIRRASGK